MSCEVSQTTPWLFSLYKQSLINLKMQNCSMINGLSGDIKNISLLWMLLELHHVHGLEKSCLMLPPYDSSLMFLFGCVYTGRGRICSVPFGIRSTVVTDLLCLHGTGSKLEQYGSIWDHLHKWTYLLPDSRSDPYWIHQVPCKHKATRISFVPVPNGPGPM